MKVELCMSLPHVVCMPVSAGEECLEKVNGTCVLFEPIIDDCGQ